MALSPPRGRAVVRGALAALLLVVAFAVYEGRKLFIQSFFARGPGGAPPPALAPPPASPTGSGGAGLAPAEFVRVVLLDGVDRETARRLPRYDQICQLGLELVVDVGFPTVSLPVQSVLWTGLTQQQSGIEFVQERIHPPPDGSLPAREPSSAAVAESHPFISQSFGFAKAWPAVGLKPAGIDKWKAGPFEFTALGQVGSDTRLVFVHLVGPDSAGHKFGRDSREFEAAAALADKRLGDLVAIDAANHGPRSRWLVLADHGHRPAGGHGGEEPAIRLIRACLAGAGVSSATAPRGRLVHMVDLSRALADSLGLPPHAHSAGRPIYSALAAPEQPGITLPRPGAGRLLVAALVVGAALAMSWTVARRSWRLPWWWVLAYLSVVAIEGAPTLSTPMVYKPLGQAIYVAALPGLCLLAVLAGLAARTGGALRVVLTELTLPAAACVACAILCWRDPPLMPLWSAQLSMCMVLLFTGAVVVALACLASLVPFGSGPGSPPETTDREP
jgi:Type I phosphodiesterase / nucleotide pyrophosphatase